MHGMDRITIATLQAMKREGRKIVGVVAWDTPMAQLAERAGVDLLSVGDSVGKNLWGHATETEVTVDIPTPVEVTAESETPPES